jgi:hypothetical protein
MICDIARNLDESTLDNVRAVEKELGTLVIAFSCRSLDPAREARLRKTIEEFCPLPPTEPAQVDEVRLVRLRETEKALGLALVAVRG